MSGEIIRENSEANRDAWVYVNGRGMFTLDGVTSDGRQAHVYLTPRGVQYEYLDGTWAVPLREIWQARMKKMYVDIYIRDNEIPLRFSSEECAAAFFRCLREAMIGKLPTEDS